MVEMRWFFELFPITFDICFFSISFDIPTKKKQVMVGLVPIQGLKVSE